MEFELNNLLGRCLRFRKLDELALKCLDAPLDLREAVGADRERQSRQLPLRLRNAIDALHRFFAHHAVVARHVQGLSDLSAGRNDRIRLLETLFVMAPKQAELEQDRDRLLDLAGLDRRD